MSFLEQLESGDREMWYNRNKLELNAPYGFSETVSLSLLMAFKSTGLTISDMNVDEEIVFTATLSSPGNAALLIIEK